MLNISLVNKIILLMMLSLSLIETVPASQLVRVPKGEIKPFWLDPTNTKTPNKVVVDSFEVMEAPVTVGEFKKFLQNNQTWKKDKVSSLFVDERYLQDINKKKDNSPVTFVSWFSARAYCESLQMRLPTLNEWEYMAAASEKNKVATDEEKFIQRILDWYSEPEGGLVRKPVKSIFKNIYGVWDLHGLIWEWVDDFNTSFVSGESREDSNFNKGMFCGAGGMSGGNKENYAAFMRYAFRSGLKGKSTVWNLGFRCVR